MFRFLAEKNKLSLLEREPVTSGSVNAYAARFEFSEDWEGLNKTAVFQAGCASREVLLGSSGACLVPWEVLRVPGYQLKAGVYGKQGGEVVLPTVWADLGMIQEGVPAGGSPPPSPELWEQALERKGDGLGYTEEGELGLYSGDKLLSAVPVVGGGGGLPFGVGHGLNVVEGDLTVDTVDDFQGDNTLPMTAAGVNIIVGNIDVLLGTI